jgi:5'-nucleotidase
MAFSGGEPLAPQIDAFDIDLFLSKDLKDVQTVIDSKKCAAAFIYNPPKKFDPTDSRVKIAFDADAVLFSDESEHRYKTQGMDAFHKYESENEDVPLSEGPASELVPSARVPYTTDSPLNLIKIEERQAIKKAEIKKMRK